MCFSWHELFNNNIIVGVITGLITGLFTGMYSSFVVTRYYIFLSLKNEVLRTIQRINYQSADSRLVLSNSLDIGNLLYMSSDFCRLGHNSAQSVTDNLFKEISRVNIQAGAGQLTIDEYEKHFLDWQQSARNIAPSKRQIFFFF